jgi:hypothetical protein
LNFLTDLQARSSFAPLLPPLKPADELWVRSGNKRRCMGREMYVRERDWGGVNSNRVIDGATHHRRLWLGFR